MSGSRLRAHNRMSVMNFRLYPSANLELEAKTDRYGHSARGTHAYLAFDDKEKCVTKSASEARYSRQATASKSSSSLGARSVSLNGRVRLIVRTSGCRYCEKGGVPPGVLSGRGFACGGSVDS